MKKGFAFFLFMSFLFFYFLWVCFTSKPSLGPHGSPRRGRSQSHPPAPSPLRSSTLPSPLVSPTPASPLG